MATIKSFTDLPQSKILAKILPLESADMKWYFWKSEIDAPKVPTFGYSKTAAESYKDTEAVYIPCWSLAALLGFLPKSLIYTPNQALDGYCCKNIMHDFETYGDNPVDACVEMIIKLHELNLL